VLWEDTIVVSNTSLYYLKNDQNMCNMLLMAQVGKAVNEAERAYL
jgi:hypothetical protein